MLNEKSYEKIYKKYCGASPKVKDFLYAFSVGGLICTIGQLLLELFTYSGVSELSRKALVPSVIIFVSGILTGLGVFDKIAKRAGAGTLVPTSGFANAVVSPAIEFKSEGYILGVGAGIFKIAGPVIAYGILASVIYGVIYYILK